MNSVHSQAWKRWGRAVPSVLCSVLGAAGLVLLGRIPGAVAQPKPDAKLDQLTYFQGRWTCRVRKAKEAKIDEFNWTLNRSLNDFWFLGQVDFQQKTLTQDTLGYNTVSQKFGRTILTHDGRFINLLSNGWQGTRFTWEGSLVNMQTQQRETLRQEIVRANDRQFSALYSTLEPTQKT